MARAIITVGTSFQDALCWDFDRVWEDIGGFPEVLYAEDVLPRDPVVREKRLEMARVTAQFHDAESFLNNFRQVDPRQHWRYPAEIDTLKTLEARQPDLFGQISKIVFVHSDDELGRLATTVCQGVIAQIWSTWDFEDSMSYPSLKPDSTTDYGETIRELSSNMSGRVGQSEPALLVATGGYKLVTLAAGKALDALDPERSYYLVYKHEDGALVLQKPRFIEVIIIP